MVLDGLLDAQWAQGSIHIALGQNATIDVRLPVPPKVEVVLVGDLE